MTNTSTSTWAYASLLAGGLLIIVGGVGGALMMGTFSSMMGNGMMGSAMMPGFTEYMTTGWIASMAWWMGIVGAATGGLVLFAAYRLRQRPDDAATVGTLAIVGGALSLLAMGGWVLGAVLAILGGALALGGSPMTPTRPDGGMVR